MTALDDDQPILRGLNPDQHRAVTTIQGPLLVLAGAGSGKTRVITHRIAWMIRSGIPPESILAVTFTNKAAREMKARVRVLTGRDEVWLGTFHSWCAFFLREEFPAIGRSGDFTIYDEADSLALVKLCLAEAGLDPHQHEPARVRGKIGRWKEQLVSPETVLARSVGTLGEAEAGLYAIYDRRLQESDACDFDDLLLQALRILEEQPGVRERWQERFTHQLVDEFQDTNLVQYRLVRALAGEGGNVCVTGDPDQAIYSWRGADPANFDRFLEDHPTAPVVALESNYRSTGHILQAASHLITHNRNRLPKTLRTDAGDGDPVQVIGFRDDYEEAQAVATLVRSWREAGLSRNEMAIFYRTNALSLPVERVLLQEGIPYQVVGGYEFFARAEVKDLVAWLRFLVNPRDTLALLRIMNVPPRGLGDRSRQEIIERSRHRGLPPGLLLEDLAVFSGLPKRAFRALEEFAGIVSDLRPRSEAGGVSRLLKTILAVTGYGTWWEGRAQKSGSLDPYQNIGQFITLAQEFDAMDGRGLAAFLEQVSLLQDTDRWSEEEDRVSLMTLHTSKGLEFDAVMIVGAERGLLPHQMSTDDPGALEEERRLLHVGLTRARRRAVVTWAASRTRFGRRTPGIPSPFLDELGLEGVERHETTPRTSGPRWDRDTDPGFDPEPFEGSDHHLAALAAGARVWHPDFGKGTVTRLKGRAGGLDRKVIVTFDGDQVRTLVLRHSNLEILEDAGEDPF